MALPTSYLTSVKNLDGILAVARIAGHVRRPFRCNVALSRAKERVIIIGAADMWAAQSDDSPMKKVLLHIASNADSGKTMKMLAEELQ